MPEHHSFRIIVTRAAEEECPLTRILTEEMKAEVFHLPMTEIRPVEFVLPDLSTFDWLFFTSGKAIKSIAHAATGIELPAIGVVGEPSAAVCEARLGVMPSFISDENTAAAAAEKFAKMLPGNDIHLLWVCGNLANPAFAEKLRKQGITVTSLVVYETHARTALTTDETWRLKGFMPDAVVFTSPSAIHNWQALRLNNADMALDMDECAIACIGPTTAEAALDVFGRAHIVPDSPSLEDLAYDIEEYLGFGSPRHTRN